MKELREIQDKKLQENPLISTEITEDGAERKIVKDKLNIINPLFIGQTLYYLIENNIIKDDQKKI